MEKLSMCRVCLGEDVRLHSIVGTHLQEMYESLVLMPLETTDGRPVLACYICCAKLKNCYELRKSCLQNEELFTQMLSSNEVKSEQVKLQGINNKKRLTMDNVVHLSLGHELEMSADNVGVEALKFEVKVEPNDCEDTYEDAMEENSVFDNVQSADSEDDFIIIVKEEQTGDRTSDPTPKESTLDDQKNPEDVTTSNLKHHELVQDTLQAVYKLTAHTHKERPTSVPRSERVQYTCDTCQQCYNSKCELEKHARVCSDVCKTDLSHNSITSTRTQPAQKLHQCLVCNKNFTRFDSLTSHMCTHSGEKPYQCGICKIRFSLKNNLIKHMRTYTGEKHMRTHTGEKLYHCGICEKQLAGKTSLIRHMRIHSGEKPYHCGICKKQFSVNSNLIRHIPTHTGEQPYHCGICKRQFSVHSNLKQHMRTHTGEKQHLCYICKKQFAQKDSLECHIRTIHWWQTLSLSHVQ